MADVDATEAEKTAAAEIVGSVDDLLLEIFGRVPSENDDRNPQFKLASKHLNSLASEYCSLFRLRLVSSRWNSLISNNFRLNPKPFPAAGLIFECGPTTSEQGHRPHSSYILFLDQSISTTAPFREINPADDPWHSHSKVVHSCNGLLLFASKRASGVYSVCNPTTGKHSALPQVPPANNKIIHGVSLAFDPCKSLLHYKVFCVLGSEHDIRYFQFVVYSSKTGSWGNRGKLLKTKNIRFGNHNSGVCWNGAIHWVGSSELVRFDLDDNDDDRLAPPKVTPMPIARNRDRYYFGESYGHLHYIGLDDGAREVVVHEMMSSDYSGGWVVKYKVDVSINRNYLKNDFEVYAVVRGERSEDTFLVLGTCSCNSWWHERRKIIRFNLNDATFKTIYDFFNGSENLLENPEKLHPFQYIESLASV